MSLSRELRIEEAEYDAYYEGQDDCMACGCEGDPRKENPYAEGLMSYDSWMQGWHDYAALTDEEKES